MFAKSSQGVDFEALDGEAAYVFYDRGSGRSRKYPSPHACRTIAAVDRYRIYRPIDEYEDAREVTALFDSKQAVEEGAKAEKRPREGKRQKESEKAPESDVISESDPMKVPDGTSDALLLP